MATISAMVHTVSISRDGKVKLERNMSTKIFVNLPV